jgi:hypothetical protein
MKLIIENNGQRREINTPFKLYAGLSDLKIIKEAVDKAIQASLDPGWVDVGEYPAPVDTKLFPWQATADEKPVYPWTKGG